MDQVVTHFLTFFTTIDPVGTLTIFVGLTAAAPAKDRSRIAFRAVAYSTAILVGAVLIGQLFLGSVGIRLAAFELAGGIIFFLFGIQMVFGSGVVSQEANGEEGRDIAIFPLAVPSIASPGAILAAVVLTDNREFTVAEQAVTTFLLLAVLGITLLLLLQANRVFRYLGKAGAELVVRVMGMVLAGLAVELILEAIEELLPSVTGG